MILSLNAGRHASVTRLALSLHLNEVAQDGFVGHVTVEAVVPLQEVRSEMMQEGVEVQRVVTVLPAVNTLAALQNTHNSPPISFTAVWLSFCCRQTDKQHLHGYATRRIFSVYRRGSASVLIVCLGAPPGAELALLHPRRVWLLPMSPGSFHRQILRISVKHSW